jgi:hypothetical protein
VHWPLPLFAVTCADVLKRKMNWFHAIKNQKEFVGGCIIKGEWTEKSNFKQETGKTLVLNV